MKEPNNEYFYEADEISVLINHPQFEPVDQSTKWSPLTSSLFSQEMKDQITELKEGERLLMPFNSRNHINGVVLEKRGGQLQVTWMDSYDTYYLKERQAEFLAALRKTGISVNPQIINKKVHQQGKEPASCGPRTMDNLFNIAKGFKPREFQDQTELRRRDMSLIDSKKF